MQIHDQKQAGFGAKKEEIIKKNDGVTCQTTDWRPDRILLMRFGLKDPHE